MLVISDTTPIISLAKANRLYLLEQLVSCYGLMMRN